MELQISSIGAPSWDAILDSHTHALWDRLPVYSSLLPETAAQKLGKETVECQKKLTLSDAWPFSIYCIIFVFQEAFSDIALFFYDVYGGDFVGVIWKPHSFVPAQFKVLTTLSYFRKW